MAGTVHHRWRTSCGGLGGRGWRLNRRFGGVRCAMSGCAAEDAEVTTNTGSLVVDVAPGREFFIAERHIASEGRLVFHGWYCGGGIGGARTLRTLLRSGHKWRQCGGAEQQCCKSELHGDPRFPDAQSVRTANGVRKEAHTQLTGSKRDQARGGRSNCSGKNSGGVVEIWRTETNGISGAGNTAIEGAPVYT